MIFRFRAQVDPFLMRYLMMMEIPDIILQFEKRIRILEGCVLGLADHIENRGTDMEEHHPLDVAEFYARLYDDDTIMLSDEVPEC